MRRGTPAAVTFGKSLQMIRNDSGMTMRQVADKMGIYPALVSKVEKGERAVKEPRIPLWAAALGVSEAYLRQLWNEVQVEYPSTPVVRGRQKCTTRNQLETLVSTLSGSERDRVLGYVTALIENR